MYRELWLSWKTFRKIAGEHTNKLFLMMFSCGVLNCYNAVVLPLVIGQVYGALENNNISQLYMVCVIGGIFISFFFVLCYFNNVYLDLEYVKIWLMASRKACSSLYNLKYDRINENFSEADILNRIDAGTFNLVSIFLMLVSILANIISIVFLLAIADKYSIVLMVLAVFVVGCSYISSKYESVRKVKYEKIKQQATDQTSALLQYAVNYIAFSKMYEKPSASWHFYAMQRQELWQAKWKQEQAEMYSRAFMGMITSIFKGFLGWSLFTYYRDKKIDSEEVASSFSAFDQLKEVAVNFSRPISNLRAFSVIVKRYDDLMSYGTKMQREDRQNTDGSIVSLKNVTYSAGDRQILKGIHLEIKEKEKVAIIGSNGCGKSSMLRLMAGLYHPVEGKVIVRGNDPGNISCEKVREIISYIPANSYMYSQSVRENIQMNNDSDQREDLDRVCELACVPTDAYENILEQEATTLSGGQMQRVNIARGLNNKVPVLLADEPDAGLPLAQGRLVIENILKDTNTVVIITHHCQYLDMFSRVLLMRDGNIILDGTPGEVKSNQVYLEWYQGKH